jgi:hypothetical protein
MYTFDDNHGAWATRAATEASEDGPIAAGKPVFFHLWPQYHDGTPKQFQYIDAAYWQFQLSTAYRDADGIVLWGPSRFPWDETSGWWAATLEFIRQLHDTAPLARSQATWCRHLTLFSFPSNQDPSEMPVNTVRKTFRNTSLTLLFTLALLIFASGGSLANSAGLLANPGFAGAPPFFDPARTHCPLRPSPGFSVGRLRRC